MEREEGGREITAAGEQGGGRVMGNVGRLTDRLETGKSTQGEEEMFVMPRSCCVHNCQNNTSQRQADRQAGRQTDRQAGRQPVGRGVGKERERVQRVQSAQQVS